MNRHGFSIVELLTVVTLIAILAGISTFGFRSATRKGGVERQTKELYADLIRARSEALYRKSPRSLGFSLDGAGKQWYAVYPSANKSGTAVLSKILSYGVGGNLTDSDFLTFDDKGMASKATTDITAAPVAICSALTGVGSVDSILVTATSIQMGKLDGTVCTYDKIIPK